MPLETYNQLSSAVDVADTTQREAMLSLDFNLQRLHGRIKALEQGRAEPMPIIDSTTHENIEESAVRAAFDDATANLLILDKAVLALEANQRDSASSAAAGTNSDGEEFGTQDILQAQLVAKLRLDLSTAEAAHLEAMDNLSQINAQLQGANASKDLDILTLQTEKATLEADIIGYLADIATLNALLAAALPTATLTFLKRADIAPDAYEVSISGYSSNATHIRFTAIAETGTAVLDGYPTLDTGWIARGGAGTTHTVIGRARLGSRVRFRVWLNDHAGVDRAVLLGERLADGSGQGEMPFNVSYVPSTSNGQPIFTLRHEPRGHAAVTVHAQYVNITMRVGEAVVDSAVLGLSQHALGIGNNATIVASVASGQEPIILLTLGALILNIVEFQWFTHYTDPYLGVQRILYRRASFQLTPGVAGIRQTEDDIDHVII